MKHDDIAKDQKEKSHDTTDTNVSSIERLKKEMAESAKSRLRIIELQEEYLRKEEESLRKRKETLRKEKESLRKEKERYLERVRKYDIKSPNDKTVTIKETSSSSMKANTPVDSEKRTKKVKSKKKTPFGILKTPIGLLKSPLMRRAKSPNIKSIQKTSYPKVTIDLGGTLVYGNFASTSNVHLAERSELKNRNKTPKHDRIADSFNDQYNTAIKTEELNGTAEVSIIRRCHLPKPIETSQIMDIDDLDGKLDHLEEFDSIQQESGNAPPISPLLSPTDISRIETVPTSDSSPTTNSRPSVNTSPGPIGNEREIVMDFADKQETPIIQSRNKQETPIIQSRNKQETPIIQSRNKQETPIPTRRFESPILHSANNSESPLRRFTGWHYDECDSLKIVKKVLNLGRMLELYGTPKAFLREMENILKNPRNENPIIHQVSKMKSSRFTFDVAVIKKFLVIAAHVYSSMFEDFDHSAFMNLVKVLTHIRDNQLVSALTACLGTSEAKSLISCINEDKTCVTKMAQRLLPQLAPYIGCDLAEIYDSSTENENLDSQWQFVRLFSLLPGLVDTNYTYQKLKKEINGKTIRSFCDSVESLIMEGKEPFPRDVIFSNLSTLTPINYEPLKQYYDSNKN